MVGFIPVMQSDFANIERDLWRAKERKKMTIENQNLSDKHTLTLEKLFLSKARVTILNLLLEQGEMSITAIVNLSKLNYPFVMAHLRKLQDYGLIIEIVKKSNRSFALNNDNPKVQAIANLKKAIEED
jgi:predicted DNA-binding transcriptional regulator